MEKTCRANTGRAGTNTLLNLLEHSTSLDSWMKKPTVDGEATLNRNVKLNVRHRSLVSGSSTDYTWS